MSLVLDEEKGGRIFFFSAGPKSSTGKNQLEAKAARVLTSVVKSSWKELRLINGAF